jgi:hypothetical protein
MSALKASPCARHPALCILTAAPHKQLADGLVNGTRVPQLSLGYEHVHRLGELRQGLQNGRRGSGTGVGTNGRERGGLVANGCRNPRRNDQP